MPLLNSRGEWFRFSDYEIVRKNEHFYYIRSTKKAQIDYYQPFREFPKILKDFFVVAERLDALGEERSASQWPEHIKKAEEEQAERVRWFTKKYGSLGIFYELIAAWIYEQDSITVALHKPLHKSIMLLPEYLSYFFPEEKPQITDRKQCYAQNFLRSYSEEASYAANEMIGLFRHFKWFENKKRWWNETLSVYPVSITVSRSGNDFVHDFGFSSLLSAINLILLKNYTEFKQPLRKCPFPDCGYFIAERRDRLYCDKHQYDSRLRVDAYRERKKTEKSKTVAPQGANKPVRRKALKKISNRRKHGSTT